MPVLLPYQDAADAAIRGICVPGFGHLVLSALPWYLRDGEAEDGVIRVKGSHTRRVLTFEVDIGAGHRVRAYAKRHRARSWLKALGYRFYPSKAWREWRAGWALVRRGMLTGRPVVVAERRHHGLVRESFLVIEAIKADMPLHDYLAQHSHDERLVVFCQQLGDFLKRLHGLGFYHDDLSSDHLWIRLPAGEGDSFEFGLIDVDQGRFARHLGRARRLKNLFQILRSLPETPATTRFSQMLLAAYFGPAWQRERTQIIDQLNRISLRKESRVLFAP